MTTRKQRAAIPLAAALALATLGLPGVAGAQTTKTTGTENVPPTRLLMPQMNSARGRELFVSKGCVTCHSVNGIGGEDAAALDAHDMAPYMGLFDLTAKMWSMAPVMIPAQEEELGAQIQLNGDELSDLIAFLHDDMEQAKLSMDALSEEQRATVAEMANMDGGEGDSKEAPVSDPGHVAYSQPTRLLMPQMNAEEGRKLFVSKGCATCHSINGVGGDFGPALDASGEAPFVSLFDVPARMWSKAPVMIPAQEDQLGEQIQLTGSEMADLVAFLNSDREQAMLTPFALEE